MDKFGKILKKLREDRNISAIKFSEDLSIHRGTLSNWETGRRTPDSQTLLKIAEYFSVTVDYLLGNTDTKTNDNVKISDLQEVNTDKMVKIPVLGVIKAGIPMFAEDNIIDYEYVHQEELMQGENYFYLQVKGDSMINARIYEGDRVRIKKTKFFRKRWRYNGC